ncbi:unnamed protein product [Kuraishia capsulata CBS 1993]|uniref:Uncharacterized protein n=1 Tax=Kuraishia capsulata CBS 1993 TaxID=1382522 RepID=W6MQ20_9ASCO|nr:uncharacterized protein KUCA_T00003310001 [Kuraishia capsulata CBS 1993]CDK27332.1 unnamed protein product [Kuraishia capsulata CBS 1993]
MSLHGHAFKYIRHGPNPVPQVPKSYAIIAKALGATMWCWIFYRAKHDYKVWFVSAGTPRRRTPLSAGILLNTDYA